MIIAHISFFVNTNMEQKASPKARFLQILVNLDEDFPAEALLSRLFAGHDALGSGD